MKRTRHIILTSFIALFGVVAAPVISTAGAINPFEGTQQACGGGTGSAGASAGAGVGSSAGSTSSGSSSSSLCGATKTDDLNNIIKNVINTLLMVLGMIAVIMIIIGGVRYTTSGGDASQIQAAKNTILYAVVGLVVAILAYAIVNFVLNAFK